MMESYAQQCRTAYNKLELHLRALTLREALTKAPLEHINSILTQEQLDNACEHIHMRKNAMQREMERLDRVATFIRLLNEQRS